MASQRAFRGPGKIILTLFFGKCSSLCWSCRYRPWRNDSRPQLKSTHQLSQTILTYQMIFSIQRFSVSLIMVWEYELYFNAMAHTAQAAVSIRLGVANAAQSVRPVTCCQPLLLLQIGWAAFSPRVFLLEIERRVKQISLKYIDQR